MEEMPLVEACVDKLWVTHGDAKVPVEDGTYSKDSEASLHISKVQGSRPPIHSCSYYP